MTTESPIRIIEASGKWSTSMGVEDIGVMLKGQRFQGRKSNLPPNRSGSAPPSIEGSFAAIENLMFRQDFASPKDAAHISESEEQLRADPSYFEYYWAHVNLNPRLPPPLVSGENRNLYRNGTGYNRRLTSYDDSFSSSLRLHHSDLSTHKEESDDDRSPEKEDLPQAQSPAFNQSCSFTNEPIEEADNHDNTDPTTTTFSSSSSTDGRGDMLMKTSMNKSPNSRSEGDVSVSGVPAADVSGIRNGIAVLNISNFQKLDSERNQRHWQQEHMYAQRTPFPLHASHSQIASIPQQYMGMNRFLQNSLNFSSEVRPILQSSGFSPPHYATDPGYTTPGNHVYPNLVPTGYFPQQYTIGGYGFNPSHILPYATGYVPNSSVPTHFSGQSQTSVVNMQHFNNLYGHPGIPFGVEEQKLQAFGGLGHVNVNSRRGGPINPYYFGSLPNMDFLQFPTSPFASPLMPGSPIGGVGHPGRRNEGGYGGWRGHNVHNGNHVTNDPKTYSFLEELKSGKGRRFELSDISGHIVELSVDQHGSRFIQQKLEICSNEQKESVFKEVLPHASKLITDVFGNYVIQKFFEYGSAEQRRELGNQLQGQILPLSLQMYGCRVIQKALDAVDLEQKTKLIRELDGHVLKCVRDQNGNHVIQKCIESIPTENIKFMISSFRGQVAALSKHPYGCRVIQRVLEHSTDELHSQFVVDEILDSVYDLAQDQYGNYVTQYVLEGGKPEERSQLVHKLAGHIVQLSQHKFASNVIEKCLEYGDSAAREIMVEEIIGHADGSDNLLVMVKDQFANYVVQKVLQTCSGHQREVLLDRIKFHLNSLKKYTYGKHIVARFEQLYGEEIGESGT